MTDPNNTAANIQPPIEEASLPASIAEYNAALEARSGIPQGADEDYEPEIVEAADEPEIVNKESVVTTAKDAEGEKKVVVDEAEKKDEFASKPESFAFTPDADPDTFEREKAAYLDTVEITPELQQILDRQTAEIGTLRNAEPFPDAARATKTLSAFDALFETEVIDNEIVPNTKPIIELLKTDYRNEFPTVAVEILSQDSGKYQGASMFEEVLMDQFKASPEKVQAIHRFLAQGDLLPPPPAVTPTGIDAAFGDAWRELPEARRFQIESAADDLNDLRQMFKNETDAAIRTDLAQEIDGKERFLQAENQTLRRIQQGINSERQTQDSTARQRQDAELNIANKVVESFNKDVYSLADALAQDLAPSLSFLDGDAQLSMANNIQSRIIGALETDAAGKRTPNAEYIAARLKSEGIDFDFGHGSALIHRLYQAQDKLTRLEEARHSSPAAVENARKVKGNLVRDIKVEQKALLGQISSKYVKSSSATLEKKTAAVVAKEQKTRAVITKNAAPPENKTGDTSKEIADYNARLRNEIGDGDGLYEFHAR